MAYDKVVDSAELDAIFDGIGDVIREKNKTTDKIPHTALEDAIRALSGGGGQYAWKKFDASGNFLGYAVSDNAEEYPENGTAEDGFVYKKENFLFSFTVKDKSTGEVDTYYATDGMTWGEWIDSEYNTDGCYSTENMNTQGMRHVISQFGTQIYKFNNNLATSLTVDIIIPNYQYITDSDY